MAQVHPGGCLCGAVRFEAHGEPGFTGYCHCRMCQRSSGGPVQVYAGFPADKVVYASPPAIYASSPGAERHFCPKCGSQVAFRDADGMSVNVPCLDDPSVFPPREHIWEESRIAWFHVADDLPRHPRDAN
jgi:hypothetical protein